jgi:hypothetical protein
MINSINRWPKPPSHPIFNAHQPGFPSIYSHYTKDNIFWAENVNIDIQRYSKVRKRAKNTQKYVHCSRCWELWSEYFFVLLSYILLDVLTKNPHDHQISTCNKCWNLAPELYDKVLISRNAHRFCKSWSNYSIFGSLESHSHSLNVLLRSKSCKWSEKADIFNLNYFLWSCIDSSWSQMKTYHLNESSGDRLLLSNELTIEYFAGQLQKLWGF